MKVAVIGTGYVGLVTGCCLATAGHEVTCIDNNEQKIKDLVSGKVPIYEPGLEEVMRNAVKQGKLSFTLDLSSGVKQADAIFLALPTPPQADGSADLSAVLSVAGELGKHLPKNYCVVINKSTVPVGTVAKVRELIAKHHKSDFDVISNPEFLREGYAVQDFNFPERVVVGTDSDRAEKLMRDLYESFVDEERPLYVTDPTSAELIKYAANSFLVTKISFMNEIANLCEAMGADVDLVRRAIGADSRIGQKFLYPGIGCGGSCFPKDVRALLNMSEDYAYDFRILQSAMNVNQDQQKLLATKLKKHFNGKLKGKTFALWGLAFKPDTDDIREAPALVIIDELIKAGAKIKAYDPEAAANVRSRYGDEPNLEIVENKYAALDSANALLIATEWKEFGQAELERIKQFLLEPVVFDGRNIYGLRQMEKAGLNYYSIGRRTILQPKTAREFAKP